MWSPLAPKWGFLATQTSGAPNRTPLCPHCPVCCHPSHPRACLFQSCFHNACSRPCLVPFLQGLLLRVPCKHTLSVLGIQSATHTRDSQCAVRWCSPYQGFPSMIRAYSCGMAVCVSAGGLYMSTNREPPHIHAHQQPTFPFTVIAGSLQDTILWAPVVCRPFAVLILPVSRLVRCSERLFPATWHKQLQVQV